jgi:hypothetical protein
MCRVCSVKRSFTKTVNYLRFSTYKERLVNLGLDSLQCGRVKVDLLFCYKLLHGLVDIKSDDLIIRSPNIHLRVNQYKLAKPLITPARDANIACKRVINIWNCLPDHIVKAETISGFKRRLHSFNFSGFVKF